MATRRATARRTEDVEVLPPAHADVQLVSGEGSAVATFIGNMTAFFSRAGDLEQAAKRFLVDAKALQPPTTAEEDYRIQQVIRTANATKKTVEEHWGICQIVHSLHRKLTAKRGVAVAALDEAAGIAQRLHNRYVDAERERARLEEERRRQEEEARQREAQERQARQLETQALEAEASMDGLSERESVFVERVFAGMGPTQAARTAGYKDPEKQGERLMATSKVTAALEAKRTAEAARKQAEAVRRQPVAVDVEREQPQIMRAGVDRTTWSGEIIDEMATIMAFRAGSHGIPPDLFQINPTKLNEYARSLNERLDLWSGVRAKKTTKTV